VTTTERIRGRVAGAARTIVHVDMDAFFVSVELRGRPELRGLPVVVGGTGRRGVVAAASYEARRYGVHSAMPSTRARQLCPQAVFLPGDHALYESVSIQVQDVFRSFTPLVEPISLDEAFLDATGSLRLFGDGVTIAHAIRQRVLDETELTCSVGVAPTKFLAKLASEAAKPKASSSGIAAGRGVVHVAPNSELAFLHPHRVEALWGVGPATLERLHRIGVTTIGELARVPVDALVATLGRSAGMHLNALANGIDERDVEPDRAVKSIGHEQTFPTDLFTSDELDREAVRMADAVATRLRGNGLVGRTVSIKVRFGSFATITRSITAPDPIDTAVAITALARSLLKQVDPSPGVRLLGVSIAQLATCGPRQLRLEDLIADEAATRVAGVAPGWDEASQAIDEIRKRFGSSSIGPASLVRSGPDGRPALVPLRRGQQQWGPDAAP